MDTPINQVNFLLSLAVALAGVASPPLSVGDASKGGVTFPEATDNLWVLHAVESSPGVAVSGPYAVLRIYGGPAPDALSADEISVQIMCSGLDQSDTLNLARRLYETLFAANSAGQKKARNAWMIPGYTKDATTKALVLDPALIASKQDYEVRLVKPAGPPGLVGRDPNTGVWNCPFSFNVRYGLPDAAS